MHTSSRSFVHSLMFSLCATSLTAACSDKHLTGGSADTQTKSRLGGGIEPDDGSDDESDSDAGVGDDTQGPDGTAEDGGVSTGDKLVADAGEIPTSADTGVVLGGVDSDGDGFSDAVERSAGKELGINFGEWGASPDHKDVFLYMDYYDQPDDDAIEDVVTAFANAKATNPDGYPGITLHPIWGTQIPPEERIEDIPGPLCVDPPATTDWVTDYDTKFKNKYFPEQWRRVAHYVLFGHFFEHDSTSGCSRGIPAHDLIVTLGPGNPWNGGSRLQQAGTLMHELGHNLGLKHGGAEDTNYKANYLSIMNYTYQVHGLVTPDGDHVIDYSRLQIGQLDEGVLNENAGMLAVAPTTQDVLKQYGARFWANLEGFGPNQNPAVDGKVGGWLDFNNNHVPDPGTYAFDLNGNGTTDVFPPSCSDWDNLQYQGAEGGGGIIGDSVPTAAPTWCGSPSTQRYVVDQLVSPDDMGRELGAP